MIAATVDPHYPRKHDLLPYDNSANICLFLLINSVLCCKTGSIRLVML